MREETVCVSNWERDEREGRVPANVFTDLAGVIGFIITLKFSISMGTAQRA